MSKLQLLTSKLESLKMKDNEHIHEFNMVILEISNAFKCFGRIDFRREVGQVSPKKFDLKVTVVEEAQDINNNMIIDELLGSLQMTNLKRRTRA